MQETSSPNIQELVKSHLQVLLVLVKVNRTICDTVKNATMELGGLAPFIVHKDADIDLCSGWDDCF